MVIHLQEWKIVELNYHLNANKSDKTKYDFHVFTRKGAEDQLVISFEFVLEDADFILHGQKEFYFKTEGAFRDDWLNSDFVRINAPAIAYPYLRSFISQYTLLSGQGAVVLPAVNFVALAEEQQ